MTEPRPGRDEDKTLPNLGGLGGAAGRDSNVDISMSTSPGDGATGAGLGDGVAGAGIVRASKRWRQRATKTNPMVWVATMIAMVPKSNHQAVIKSSDLTYHRDVDGFRDG